MTNPHPSPPPDPAAHDNTHTPAAAANTQSCPRCAAVLRAAALFCNACGLRLPTEPGTDVVPAPKAPAPPQTARPATSAAKWKTWSQQAWSRFLPQWDATTRRRGLIAIATVVVLVIAYAGFNVIQSRWYDPQEPIEEYFAELEARPGYTPPTDVTVGDANHSDTGWDGDCLDDTCRPDGQTATVDVSYTLDGQRYDTTMGVSRDSSGWFRPWVRAEGGKPSQLTVSAPPAIPQLNVAGEPVDVHDSDDTNDPDGSNGVTIDVDPGVYTITVPDNPLVDSADTTITVPFPARPDDTATVAITDIDINPDAVDDVTALVKDKLDKCASGSAGKRDPGCGWTTHEMLIEEDSIRWEITRYPTIDLVVSTDSDSRATHPHVEVETTTPGQATMHYKRLQSDKDRTDTHTITIDGAVSVDDNDTLLWPADKP